MKNAFKKVIASAMAVTSLTMGTVGINVSATDTNALGNTEITVNENPTRSSFNFVLYNQSEIYLTAITGSRFVNYSASVNQGVLTIIVYNSSGYIVDSLSISAGYAPTFHINVPAYEVYYFYVKSNTASPSNIISGTAYIY